MPTITNYVVVNDTCYNAETKLEVIKVLESARLLRLRVNIRYGDTTTGRDWGEPREAGTVSRSCGPEKISILVATKRSMGGSGILTHCIVKITESRGGRVLYEHPRYHV